MSNNRVLYIFGSQEHFLLHWKLLPEMAVERGNIVQVALPVENWDALSNDIFVVHHLKMKRGSTNPFRELIGFLNLTILLWKVRPGLVHAFTLKPAIYAGILSRILGIPSVLTVTGLGYAFSIDTLRTKFIRTILRVLSRVAMGGPRSISTFENFGDPKKLLAPAIKNSRLRIVTGGIDVDSFAAIESIYEVENPIVMFVGRLLREKGVYHFIDAAIHLKDRGSSARFVLVGKGDPLNPGNISDDQIEKWQRLGLIEYWGWQEDMAAIYGQATIICSPSYYGEGAPRSLMEAAAAGRPVVAFRNPGTEMVVEHDITGLLVSEADGLACSVALASLLGNTERIQQMGKAARARATALFSRDKHFAMLLSISDQVRLLPMK